MLNGFPNILSMSANFEAALTASSGEFVAFIGDDDGMMPDACAICDAVMSSRPTLGTLHWVPHYYDWPSSLRVLARNRLIIRFPGQVAGTICYCRDLLRQLYDGTIMWTDAPLIYNGAFVRRAVIEKVKAFCGGRYFAGEIPDVHSGIANLWAMEEFLHIDQALSICGASGHSNGNAHFIGSDGETAAETLHAENPELHQKLVEYFLDSDEHGADGGSALVTAKEIFFKDEPGDHAQHAQCPVTDGAGRQSGPEALRPDHRRDAAGGTEIRHRHQQLQSPTEKADVDVPFHGPVTDASGRTTCLAVDGAQAGIANIADAVRVAASILPSPTPAQLDAVLPRSAASRRRR